MKLTSNLKTYYPYLDYLRVLAIIGVIVIHTFDFKAFLPLTTLVQWTVPLYAMISGALLLSRPVESFGEFYQKRFIRIGLPLITWNLIFLSLSYFIEPQFNLREALLRLIIFGQPLYFLFVLAGLYAITPFLQRLILALSKKELVTFSATCLGLAMAVSLIENWLLAPNNILPLFSFSYFLYYLGYYLFGYLIHLGIIKLPSKYFGLTAFGIAYAYTLIATLFFINKYGPSPKGLIWFGHFSPSVIAMTLALFATIQALLKKIQKSLRIISTLAKYSFGIYFTHMLIVALVKPYFSDYLLFAVAFVSSTLIVASVGRQKQLALLLGY